jgi:hypothetical protein
MPAVRVRRQPPHPAAAGCTTKQHAGHRHEGMTDTSLRRAAATLVMPRMRERHLERMPSARTGIRLVLCAVSALAGCSPVPDRPLDPSASEAVWRARSAWSIRRRHG